MHPYDADAFGKFHRALALIVRVFSRFRSGLRPGQGAGAPMFYSYCYPGPDEFKRQSVAPDVANWDSDPGEFLLPYEAVRAADDPEAMPMQFLQTTYVAAADTGNRDRASLECPIGKIGRLHALEDVQ